MWEQNADQWFYSPSRFERSVSQYKESALREAIERKCTDCRKANEIEKKKNIAGATSIATGVGAFMIGGPLGLAARIGFGVLTTFGTAAFIEKRNQDQ